MQRITPFLWYENQAEEAAKFYTSIFKNSTIVRISRYPKSVEAAAGRPAGSVMTVEFELDGQKFMALNGGPTFKFTEAVSFVVNCKDQDEVDYYWEKLTAGGREVECGWLKDKFGMSWQIVPTAMGELMTDPDPGRRERAMGAMLHMKKLDIKKLKDAAEGKAASAD